MAKGEGKYVLVQTMKAYSERFVAALILNFSTQWR